MQRTRCVARHHDARRRHDNAAAGWHSRQRDETPAAAALGRLELIAIGRSRAGSRGSGAVASEQPADHTAGNRDGCAASDRVRSQIDAGLSVLQIMSHCFSKFCRS